MQNKRDQIKWLPFDSLCNSKEMVKSLDKVRSKVIKPKLSDEQILNIENLLIDAFYENVPVNVFYYKSGYIYKLCDFIKKIDSVYHKIYFNESMLIFDQIIKVSKA